MRKERSRARQMTSPDLTGKRGMRAGYLFDVCRRWKRHPVNRQARCCHLMAEQYMFGPSCVALQAT